MTASYRQEEIDDEEHDGVDDAEDDVIFPADFCHNVVKAGIDIPREMNMFLHVFRRLRKFGLEISYSGICELD